MFKYLAIGYPAIELNSWLDERLLYYVQMYFIAKITPRVSKHINFCQNFPGASPSTPTLGAVPLGPTVRQPSTRV